MNNQDDLINVHKDITNISNDNKSHPWRRCSIGKHFTKEHILQGTRKVREYCAFNPSHKEELSEEAVIEYKSYWKDIKQYGEMPKGIRDLREYYKKLLAG